MLLILLEYLLSSWQKVSIKLQDTKFLFFSIPHTFPAFLSCHRNNNTIIRRLRLKDVQYKASLSNTVRLYTQQERQKEGRQEGREEDGNGGSGEGGESKWGEKAKRKKTATIIKIIWYKKNWFLHPRIYSLYLPTEVDRKPKEVVEETISPQGVDFSIPQMIFFTKVIDFPFLENFR